MARPDRMRGDRHALDQAEGIALHQHPVREGAAVALVGVADDIFIGARSIEHRLPFDSGRKARTAAPTQAAGFDGVDDALRFCRARDVEADPASEGGIVGPAQWYDDAATGKGEALLCGAEGEGCDIAEPVDRRRAGEGKSGSERV